MRLVVVVDGERREVEVDPVRRTVRVGDREWPVELRPPHDGAVGFEILGEAVDVREGPPADGGPGRTFSVNGELHSLAVESATGRASRPAAIGERSPSPATPAGAAATEMGPGRPVFPPMPGKVLEVRVRNGERVAAGQVLLVVEAMKMRNEVTAPVAGEVAALRVAPGANVAARDLLLRVVPG